jgi:hypothetical protein
LIPKPKTNWLTKNRESGSPGLAMPGERGRESAKRQGWLHRIAVIITSVGVDEIPFGYGSDT